MTTLSAVDYKAIFDKPWTPTAKLAHIESITRDAFLKQFPQEHHSFFTKKWKEYFWEACQNIGVKWGDHLLGSEETLKKVHDTVSAKVSAFEPKGFTPLPKNGATFAQKILAYIYYDDVALPEIQKEHLVALLLRRNPELINLVRKEFEKIFLNILDQLNDPLRDQLDVEMHLSHLLAYYPYFEPEEGMVIKIPQKIGDKWKLVEYKVEPILMTRLGFTPKYAYGLRATHDLEAPSLLLFRGTAQPTAEGALAGYISDLTPFCSVGDPAYWLGKDRIKEWVGKTPGKVIAYGTSLGGTLTYHAARHHPDKVEVRAFVPAGLVPWAYNSDKIKGKVYCHSNDPVHLFGYHPENVDFFRVYTDAHRDVFRAHSKGLGTGCHFIVKVDIKRENSRIIHAVFEIFRHIIAVPMIIMIAMYMTLKLCLILLMKLIELCYRQLSPAREPHYPQVELLL